MKGTRDIIKVILTVSQVLMAVFLTAVVLLQEGKTSGLSGAISGGADTFLSKNKAKSWDAKLARIRQHAVAPSGKSHGKRHGVISTHSPLIADNAG